MKVEVGPMNVVQICMDNASMMRKAVSIVQQQWPHLFFQGCMAHALNLLLQDWGSPKWASSIVEDAQKIVRFIRAHHVPLALFCKHAAIHAKGLSLLNPGTTRFATNFLMVGRVLDVKEALKQTITNVEWDTYVRTLSDMQRKPIQTQAQELRRLILSDDFKFWQNCANYYTVMKAVVGALKEFDGKQPCMGNVYMIMRALCQHVVALHNALFNMPSNLVESFENALRNREALVASDLHYASALLNLHLIKDMELCDEQNVMAGFMRVFQRLIDTAKEFHAMKVEFNLYSHTRLPYYGEHVWSSMGVKEVPHLWWFTSGSVGKLLPCIAQRVLIQVVSLSSCERNWSSYFMHSKAQNRLLPSLVEDLVYVYTNLRLFNQNVPFIDEAATEQYMQTIISKDFDSKGPVDLFDDYNDDSDFDTSNMSIDNENIQGQSEEQNRLQQQPQGIGEDGRDLQDQCARNANGLHIEPPREREQSLLLANSTSGDASLRTNSILHDRQEVDNQIQDPNDELQDIGTSPTAPGDMMASKERPMHDNDVPPINPVSSSHNEVIIQGTDGRGPAHYVVLPSGIDGVGTEGNALVPTLENINMLNAILVGIQEVATHSTLPFQPWQLFKSLADVPRTSVCIQPPMHRTLVGPDPSPCV